MNRATLCLRLSTCLIAVSGCNTAPEDPFQPDNEAVLDHIEALGLSRDGVVFHDSYVIVDGDMRFERSALLRGDYERMVEHSDEIVQKGYVYSGLIAKKHQGNIRLAFASGMFAPTKDIRDAFVMAAKAWSSIPGSAIRISTHNTGPAIVVRTVPVASWTKYTGCDRATDGCANIPLNGRPGYELFVRGRSTMSGCATWTPSNLANLARHELGHALGFAHPKEDEGIPVDGTRECTAAVEDDCTQQHYPTVMGAPVQQPGCVVSPARLTKDDYATSAAVYPAQ